MNKFQDVFISYGRIDSKAFAKKLNSRLVEQGLEVWFDFDDIPLGVDYQNQIDDGIEKADNFLFIIAPHSINSFYCLKEIELALKRKKRIIPLLHVEQISKETWQQRLPNGNGTDEEWEAYKAQGKHSSFANMHPEIGKINWVYFRENIDDFEAAFQGLLAILERQKTYVHQHTVLLAKALEWERHQKQSQYLLIGEERQEAEQWLKVRFKEEQPPCIPTEIHCEYITESIKNANNLMTQVFLSYADEDRPTMEQIRNSLRRESITVWTNKTDIQTGEAFDEAIKRGIEQADNLVFLLSPDAVKSNYCQRELDLAVSLNKRIIPVLVSQTDPDQVPIALHTLQYINLTNNVKEDDYLLNESQLLKILHEDAAYYNEHKVLLTKALKWKRQNENPSILLRGYNLRSAETWLKVAQKRTQHRPIELQEEFITQSLQQPPLESIDIFISYSRADSDFARKLNDTLQMQGKTTWFDQESIASGSDFQQEIYRGIKACDNFLFILSPRSVNSPYCKDEVEYAASLNKRFVTVLHREVNPGDLHPELAKVQWIDFNQNDRDFNANFNQLLRSVDTDREYVHNHTKWLQRALEWQQKDKSADLLLRGNEFVIALNWLEETEKQKKKPAATELQKVFIAASQNAIAAAEEQEKHRQAEMLRLQEERTKEVEARLAEQKKSAKRQKLFLVAVSAALVAAVGVSIVALDEKRKAQNNLAGQVNALSQYSNALTNSNQEFDALIEGIRAGKPLLEQRKPFTFNFRRKDLGRAENQVKEALQRAFLGVKELNRIEGQTDVTVSPDKRTIATITQDGKVRLWNFQGKEQERKPLSHNSEKIRQVYFNKDGSKIATVSGEGNKRTIQLWNSQGQYDRAFAPVEKFDYMDFSPNDQLIYTSYWESGKRTAKLWKIEGKQLQPLLLHEKFNDVSFSKEGNKIATVSGEGNKRTIKLWNGQGQLIREFAPVEKFDYMGFSPNAQLIYTTSRESDKPVKLWKIEGKQLQPLLPDEKFNHVSFSDDNKLIATTSNKMIKLWTQDGEELQTLYPGTVVNRVYFDSKGKTIATVSSNQTVSFWNIDSSDRKLLEGQNAKFINNSEFIATIHDAIGENQRVKIWNWEGKPLESLPFDHQFNDIRFSDDRKLIATFSGEWDNRTAKLWSVEGKQPQRFLSNETFNGVDFSNDGKLIATYSGEWDNRTVKLWSVEGRQPQSLLSNETFNDVGFSN
ncbi:toll/interleukin-1 receptor domain-containing protein, partial [Floridanema aerugineum]